jgi:ABC-type multidrug transport system ATPase subunit
MIRLDNIYKAYRSINVLKGVSFDINFGELLALVGKIGSGKTTIINLMCGLIKPDKGKLFYKDRSIDFSDRSYIKDWGFLLSGDYLLEDFSTILYWRSIGKLLKLKRVQIENRIECISDLLDIKELLTPIGKLSSGNKMLVKFGTMLLSDPDILILDEPFIHLDILEINKIENILKNYHKEGKTIFLTTHSPEPLFRICKEILILDNGIIQNRINVNEFSSYYLFYNSLRDYFITKTN